MERLGDGFGYQPTPFAHMPICPNRSDPGIDGLEKTCYRVLKKTFIIFNCFSRLSNLPLCVQK